MIRYDGIVFLLKSASAEWSISARTPVQTEAEASSLGLMSGP